VILMVLVIYPWVPVKEAVWVWDTLLEARATVPAGVILVFSVVEAAIFPPPVIVVAVPDKVTSLLETETLVTTLGTVCSC
jgi:hypothetical protein